MRNHQTADQVSDFTFSFVLHQSLDTGQCWYYSGVEQGAPRWLGRVVLLTGAVAELEAQVRASEAVDGDGKLEELRPARTVVVVEDEAPVVNNTGLTAALEDAVLQGAAEGQKEGAKSENKRKKREKINKKTERKEDKNQTGQKKETTTRRKARRRKRNSRPPTKEGRRRKRGWRR